MKKSIKEENSYLKKLIKYNYDIVINKDVDRKDDINSTLLHKRWKKPRVIKNRQDEVRIFMAGLFSDNASPYIFEYARKYDVIAFDISPYYTFLKNNYEHIKTKRMLQDDMYDSIKRANSIQQIDLIWLYVSNTEVDSEFLLKLRIFGAPVAVICMDDKHAHFTKKGSIPNGQQPLIGSADVFLTTSIYSIPIYNHHGSAAYYYPPGSDSNMFYNKTLKKDIDVSFNGQGYGYRFSFIKSLEKKG
ncbi:MAG: hypothetical protein HQ521_00470, partial [Bacteroidetes bacterium]|nr:hypothetical protein [Bacteroidota bacterium]